MLKWQIGIILLLCQALGCSSSGQQVVNDSPVSEEVAAGGVVGDVVVDGIDSAPNPLASAQPVLRRDSSSSFEENGIPSSQKQACLYMMEALAFEIKELSTQVVILAPRVMACLGNLEQDVRCQNKKDSNKLADFRLSEACQALLAERMNALSDATCRTSTNRYMDNLRVIAYKIRIIQHWNISCGLNLELTL